MNDPNGYMAFLLFGIVFVLIDGQLILRNGRGYLRDAYQSDSQVRSVSLLVSVLFHFAALGILALVSTVDISAGSTTETVVAKLGVMLLILAVTHGLTFLILGRLKARQREQLLAEELTTQYEERHHQEPEPQQPTVAPVIETEPNAAQTGDQWGTHPQVAPPRRTQG